VQDDAPRIAAAQVHPCTASHFAELCQQCIDAGLGCLPYIQAVSPDLLLRKAGSAERTFVGNLVCVDDLEGLSAPVNDAQRELERAL
jgi:hypothetical protein